MKIIKIVKIILASIITMIMIPVVCAGIIIFIVSNEIQPENIANLTADVISVTLSKDNLKKVTVADVSDYLPAEIKKELSPDATLEDVVPIAFNNITGLDSYISMESVEQMIEDDVVRDVTMAILNEKEYDLVALADKYDVKLKDEEKTALAQIKTSTIKKELGVQGYNVDEIVSEQIESGMSGESSVAGQASSSIVPEEILAYLNPGIVLAGLIATILVFYLLLSLVTWSLKTGLIFWGAGIFLVGAILLTLNIVKFSLLELAIGATSMKINMTLFTPAINRVMRPVVIASVISLVVGGVAVVGGNYWRIVAKRKIAEKPINK